jgi:hypothetical protein
MGLTLQSNAGQHGKEGMRSHVPHRAERRRADRREGEPWVSVSDAQIAAIDRARERLSALKVRL